MSFETGSANALRKGLIGAAQRRPTRPLRRVLQRHISLRADVRNPKSAIEKRSVQETCSVGTTPEAEICRPPALTCSIVVPGAGFEPAPSCEEGGLRLHSHVRCVRFGPSALLRSATDVRSCPSDPPKSGTCRRVLCRIRAGINLADAIDQAAAQPKASPSVRGSPPPPRTPVCGLGEATITSGSVSPEHRHR